VTIILVTGCASKPEQQTLPCEGRKCKTADLLDNTNSREEWYCYGKKSGGEWYCGNQADDTKIVAIAPRTVVDVKKRTILEVETMNEAEAILSTNAILSTKTEPIPKLTIKKTDHSQPVNSTGKSSMVDGYPRDAYTLQIIATQNEKQLLQYIERNEITDHIVAHTLSQGSQWYVLLIGIYSGYTEAKSASLEWINNHPEQTVPWIRALGDIQDVLITQEEE